MTGETITDRSKYRSFPPKRESMTKKFEKLVRLGFHLHEGEVRCLRKKFSDGTLIEITNIAGTDLPETFGEKMRLSIYMFGELLVTFADHSLDEFMAQELKKKEANHGTISKSHKKSK